MLLLRSSMDKGGVLRAFTLFFLVTILPFTSISVEASGNSNENYPYGGILSNPYTLAGSSVISYSNNGELVAASFHTDIGIVNSTSRKFIQHIDVGNKILSLAFSNDDSRLLVGLESPYMSTLAMAIYDTTTWERVGVNEDGKEVTDISVLPGDTIFASSNENDGVTEYEIDNPTSPLTVYDGAHTDSVSCLDHSPNQQFLVTGGVDGNIFVWNRTSVDIHVSWHIEFPITDCSISPDGSRISWIADKMLQVRSLPEGDFVSTQALIGTGLQLEWSHDGDELWVLADASTPTVYIFETSNFESINSFDLGHKVDQFSISPVEAEFIVTSNTAYLTIFRQTKWQPYAGFDGVDTDFDGTPDTYDSDDDGDGIGDDFEFTCNEGTNCELHADGRLTRQVKITISGNKLSIIDSYFLNASQSSPLRQLAAAAVNSDSLVDKGEATRIERMLCSGSDYSAISSSWVEAVKLENTAIIGQSASCDAKSGLSETEKFDSKTRIELRWFIEISLANEVKRPFNLTFDPSIAPPAHTATLVTPTNPFALSINHYSTRVYQKSGVNNNSQSMSLHIEEAPESPPTFLENSVTWLKKNFWIPLLIVFFNIFYFIALVRRKNRLLFDFDDEEEEEETITTTRRKTERAQPAAPLDKRSTSGRPQPVSRPSSRRQQPARLPPDQRGVRRIRKPPGRTTQTGDAPKGETWAYEEHGAYWDSDDPDAVDPYGEASDYHEEENSILDIASEVALESEQITNELDAAEEEDYADALSMLTTSSTNQIQDEPREATGAEDMPAPVKKKVRKKVKRRKRD